MGGFGGFILRDTEREIIVSAGIRILDPWIKGWTLFLWAIYNLADEWA